VMRRCMVQIAEKMEVHRQIDTVLSARKLELRLMLLMPFMILLYLRLVFTNMISLLYGNFPGVIVMTLCLVLYVAAGVLGYRIVRTAG
ncbi:MAG: type II secretion system protein F, partial [Lachnospiraceae bacterium]|nr:type II secretion system protein F [Lachnospiraceae bacterium]